MNPTVTLGDKTHFTVNPDETILAAATRQNLNLPHSCKSGICGQCKADLLGGSVEMDEYSGKAFSAEERAQGRILLCRATIRHDVEIDIRGYDPDALPVRTMPARIESVVIKCDVAVLRLALPKNPPFRFHAGQYVDLLLQGNAARSYSIANAPDREGVLELHIRKRENGLCSDMIFGSTPSLKAKSIVRIKGPLGAFTLQSGSEKPIILLATGTGFAPIRSMLVELIGKQSSRAVHLYWGARHEEDLYALDEARDLTGRLKNGRFTAVLSRPDKTWQGASGYVQEVAARDYPDLSGHEVYACGSAAMIESASALLPKQCGLPQNAFYSDTFSAAV